MKAVAKIERLFPRDGVAEWVLKESRGYKLADPQHGSEMHHAKYAVHVQTLDEAAVLIESKGFSIWMMSKTKRPSLICPKSIRITSS